MRNPGKEEIVSRTPLRKKVNFGPVADLCTNPKNTVIGDRAYGSNPEQVANFVSANVLAHLSEGVQPCIKHFPGHGDTFLDSHEALPTVNTPLEVLRSREWLPFRRAIAAGCNFVMCGHLVLPVLDANFLTTFSSVILGQYLRKELNFSGVIVSDDLEMGAVVKNYTKDEIPVLALKAGCDLLCYRSETEAAIALEAIKKAVKERILDANLLKKSIARTRKFKGMAGGITAGA